MAKQQAKPLTVDEAKPSCANENCTSGTQVRVCFPCLAEALATARTKVPPNVREWILRKLGPCACNHKINKRLGMKCYRHRELESLGITDDA
jgi:hypothetical protein